MINVNVGDFVCADYHGVLVEGTVTETRVRNRDRVAYLQFDAPLPVGFRGVMRDSCIVNVADIIKVLVSAE